MSLTRSLTRPLTRKISRADLTQGFGGSFSPFALDPYLLFDARDSMVGTLENPTLDLNPALPETLDVITATRAGTATYTDPDGLIATASADTVRVDYTQGAELTPTKFQRVPYSTPDSNWTTVNSTLVENFDAAPDGTQSASKVTKLAVSGSGSSNDRVKYQTISIANGTTYSVSVHLKNIDVAGFTTISARVSGGSLFRVRFIWDTSVLTSDSGTTSNRLVEDVGNGWYRVSFSFDANGSAVEFEIDIDRSSGGREDTSSILVWGAQLEEGTTASDFVENTTGSPKFITGATYGPRVPMILVEPSATNLLSYSEDFSNPDWTKSAVFVDSNQTEAPNGSIVADKLMEEGVNQTHLLFKAGITDLGTISVYAKQGDANNRLFQIRRDGGSNSWSWFDLQAGTVEYQTQGVASIEDAGNGWHRCTFTPTNSNGTVVFGLSNGGLGRGESYTGDGTSGVYIWGAQLETGSVATSYIPTSGSTVTRAADDLVISGSDFSDFYNASEGTVYAESVTKKSDGQPFVFSANSDTSNRIIYYYNTTTTASVYAATSGVGQVNSDVGNRPSAGALSRGSVSYKTNNVQGSVDGGSVVSDTNVSIPSVNKLTIGNRVNLVDQYNLNGHIKRLIYWPYHSDSL